MDIYERFKEEATCEDCKKRDKCEHKDTHIDMKNLGDSEGATFMGAFGKVLGVTEWDIKPSNCPNFEADEQRWKQWLIKKGYK